MGKGEGYAAECPLNPLPPEGSPPSAHDLRDLRSKFLTKSQDSWERGLAGHRCTFPELPLSRFPTPTRLLLFFPDLGDLVEQMDCEGIRTKLQRVQQGSVWREAGPYASLPPAK